MLTIDPSPALAAAVALGAEPKSLQIEACPMPDIAIEPATAVTNEPALRAGLEYERRLALGRIRRARTLTFLLEARRAYFVARGYDGTPTAEDAEVAVAHMAFMDPTVALDSEHGSIADSVAGGAAIVELMNRAPLRFHERRSAQRHG